MPGFPGSEIATILPELSLNASRNLLFGVRFTGADHFSHAALLTYDAGTMTYQTLLTSDQSAPGSSGANYGLDLVPGSIDDAGDIAFEASSISVASNAISTTLYILPSGALAVVRIVGSRDTPPAACSWCSASAPSFLNGVVLTGVAVSLVAPQNTFLPALNARSQVLLSLWGGLFIGSKDGSLALIPTPNSGAVFSRTCKGDLCPLVS